MSRSEAVNPEATGMGVRGARRSRGPRRGAGERILIGIVGLYAGVLLLGPLVALVWGSLAEGAGEFLRQVTSPDAVYALWLTLLLAVSATAINTVFGVCVAYVLVRDNFRVKTILNGLVDLPFAVSPVIAGFMIILLFGRMGWLAPITQALRIKVVFAIPSMLLATIFISLPFVIREVMPLLAHAGLDQEHAAYTMGASQLQTFWHVTLPCIRSGLLYGVSLSFARAVGEIGAVLVVSGDISRSTETATLFIYRSLDDRNYVGAYAMAVVLVAISLAILIFMEFLKKSPEAADR
ncbi:MAG TPA: sulfate ABC transporter permease subunit [Blastocatellia bacterium]|nr:sulfate ABC transporter permease subunit [Blastocatellia bacterium]